MPPRPATHRTAAWPRAPDVPGSPSKPSASPRASLRGRPPPLPSPWSCSAAPDRGEGVCLLGGGVSFLSGPWIPVLEVPFVGRLPFYGGRTTAVRNIFCVIKVGFESIPLILVCHQVFGIPSAIGIPHLGQSVIFRRFPGGFFRGLGVVIVKQAWARSSSRG